MIFLFWIRTIKIHFQSMKNRIRCRHHIHRDLSRGLRPLLLTLVLWIHPHCCHHRRHRPHQLFPLPAPARFDHFLFIFWKLGKKDIFYQVSDIQPQNCLRHRSWKKVNSLVIDYHNIENWQQTHHRHRLRRRRSRTRVLFFGWFLPTQTSRIQYSAFQSYDLISIFWKRKKILSVLIDYWK